MLDRDRFKLLGTYATPRVRIGTVLSCEFRDCDVIVVGYTNGRIPWPVGRRKGSSARTLVVYGGLADAVKKESNLAVCHWFGVTPQTVSDWRKALGVGSTTAGTHRLQHDYAQEPWAKKALAKAQAKSNDPERRRKLSIAFKGKKRPRHVIEAMRNGRKGKPQPPHVGAIVAASRRKLRATGQVPFGRVWTVKDDQIVREHPANVAARLLERSLKSVYSRRVRLGLPDGRASNGGRRTSNAA
jgi:hypothetical protein